MSEWRHDDDGRRWELGYYDEPRQEWVTVGGVTDAFLEQVALSPEKLAAYFQGKFGSVPPPLAGRLPPEPPIRYEGGVPL